MITVEIEYDKGSTVSEVAICCDVAGLELLMKQLNVLKTNGGHVHLMTPSWAGNELSEERQGAGNTLVNHLRVVLKPS